MDPSTFLDLLNSGMQRDERRLWLEEAAAGRIRYDATRRRIEIADDVKVPILQAIRRAGAGLGDLGRQQRQEHTLNIG